MKVLECTSPGSFNYTDRSVPELKPGHAILKIKRIGICGTDLHAYQGTQPYFSYPRILGHELAADVVAIDGTADFKPGEKVSLIPYFNCGSCIACKNGLPNCCAAIEVFGVHIDGGMSAYISVPHYALLKAEGLSYDELALVEPLAIGAHGIRRANVRQGEFVLVIGAGPIGLGTMEFARIAGARVIALDINARRLEFCRTRLNLEYVINGAAENVSERLLQITGGDLPTVVIDATGNRAVINNALHYLAQGGRFVLIGLQKDNISFSHPEFHRRETTLMSSRNATREDFVHVMQAMKKGWVKPTTYITHRVAFDLVKDVFDTWLDPAAGVIKAMVELD